MAVVDPLPTAEPRLAAANVQLQLQAVCARAPFAPPPPPPPAAHRRSAHHTPLPRPSSRPFSRGAASEEPRALLGRLGRRGRRLARLQLRLGRGGGGRGGGGSGGRGGLSGGRRGLCGCGRLGCGRHPLLSRLRRLRRGVVGRGRGCRGGGAAAALLRRGEAGEAPLELGAPLGEQRQEGRRVASRASLEGGGERLLLDLRERAAVGRERQVASGGEWRREAEASRVLTQRVMPYERGTSEASTRGSAASLAWGRDPTVRGPTE